MRGWLSAAAVAAVLIALAGAARAAGPTLQVGVAEDEVKQGNIPDTLTKLDLLKLAGLDAVRVTSIWDPASPTPDPGEVIALNALIAAAKLDGIQVYVSVYNRGSATTPLTDDAQTSFAGHVVSLLQQVPDLTDVIIGNEPNINLFWMPQFNPDGTDAAAPAYLSLLARTYQAAKAVRPSIRVWGGALSPRGADRPLARPTHSPTVFLADMGAAFKERKWTTPVMDGLAIHPYPINSSIDPSKWTNPKNAYIGLGDYTKLEDVLTKAFGGTAQPSSTLPLLYDEFGIESQIPAAKRSLYTGTEPATTKPATEAQQASYYRTAISMAFCQPNVVGLLLFHAFDETDLGRFQSGIYYADETPKPSMAAVRGAVRDVRGGVIAKCAGLELAPKAKVVFPRIRTVSLGTAAVGVTCDLDCAIDARLERLPTHATTWEVKATAQFGQRTAVKFPTLPLKPGRYRFTVQVSAPVNSGPPTMVASGPLLLG
jgi:hypothetical protein